MVAIYHFHFDKTCFEFPLFAFHTCGRPAKTMRDLRAYCQSSAWQLSGCGFDSPDQPASAHFDSYLPRYLEYVLGCREVWKEMLFQYMQATFQF